MSETVSIISSAVFTILLLSTYRSIPKHFNCLPQPAASGTDRDNLAKFKTNILS